MGYVDADALFDLFGSLRVERFSIQNPHVLAVSEDARIVSYELKQNGLFGDEPYESHTYSTSFWQLREGRWQVTFHQETPVKQA
jgi:hypothetical protein